MNHIFICPKCGAAFGCEENTKKVCSDCRVLTVDTGLSESEWYAMAQGERAKRINEIRAPASQVAAEQTGAAAKAGGGSGWVSLLRTMVVIILIAGIISALAGGITLMAVNVLLGLVVLILGVLASFVSVAAAMIFLDLADDVRESRMTLQRIEKMIGKS